MHQKTCFGVSHPRNKEAEQYRAGDARGDVTSSLPSLLHAISTVTSVFRSTEELNTFCFLLMGRDNAKGVVTMLQMLLEIISPGKKHPGMQPAQLSRQTAPSAHLQSPLLCQGRRQSWAAQQPGS